MTIARLPISGIVKATGFTKDQINYRIKKLKEDGVEIVSETYNGNITLYDESIVKQVLNCEVNAK